jgi:hypothetical protein
MSDAPKHRIPINPLAWGADDPVAAKVAAKEHERAQGVDRVFLNAEYAEHADRNWQDGSGVIRFNRRSQRKRRAEEILLRTHNSR